MAKISKTLFHTVILLLSAYMQAQAPALNFTVNNNSPSYSITCTNPSVSLSAVSNYTPASAVNYVWASASNSYSGSSVAINFPGTYTVIASVSSPSLISTQTLEVSVNTVQPQSALSPTFQTINCTNLAPIPVSLTAVSPSINVTHQVTSPVGGVFMSSAPAATYAPGSVGTYTYLMTNLVNGCAIVKTFTVFSNYGHPTFTLQSSSNFSLGCATKSVSSVFIPSVVTAPTMGSPVLYAFMPPGSTGSPTFQPGLTQTTITTPGNWTVYVKDAGTSCVSSVVLSILQNTVSPILNPPNVPVLDCSAPSATIQLTSNVPSATYSWIKPGAGSVNGSSFSVTANTALPSSSVLGTYTVSATDPQNMCQSNLPLNILQNLYPPFAKITSLSNYFCDVNQVTLTNGSTSGIPPGTFNVLQPVIAQTWLSANSPSVQNSATYTATGPGTYTLTAKDLNNGCTSQTVITLSGCVSIPEYSGSQNVSDLVLWPNPNNGHFDLSFNTRKETEISCELTALTGQRITELLPAMRHSAGDLKVIVRLSDLNSGIYFVRLRAENQEVVKKLIVTH